MIVDCLGKQFLKDSDARVKMLVVLRSIGREQILDSTAKMGHLRAVLSGKALQENEEARQERRASHSRFFRGRGDTPKSATCCPCFIRSER